MIKKSVFRFGSALLLSLAALAASGERIRVGHGGGFLSAALYAAQDSLAGQVDMQELGASSDIFSSLLAGALDAGFIDADKLAAFSAQKGFEELAVAGKITYPYGATLVLRKGLDVGLRELNGLTVAVSAPNCILLKDFTDDALRFDADISGIKYERVAFNTMIPALEAGKVDAAIIKGAYSIVALQEGHSILYQNWDMVPGDECCPAVIEQAISVLLVRRSKLDEVKPFIDALVAAQERSPDELRRAVAAHTAIPFEVMEGQPVPEFSIADDGLVKIFVDAENEHNGGGDHDDGDDDNNNSAAVMIIIISIISAIAISAIVVLAKTARGAFLLTLREIGFFFKGAALNIFSPEFLTVFIPLLGLWELLPRLGIVPRTLVPPISDVAVMFWEMLLHQDFLGNVGNSMVKFFLGLGIAIVTAIPIGVLMGWNMAVRKRTLPLFQLLSPIPPPAWVPITIILFGIGLPMQTFLIFIGAFYPILFNTYQAVKDTDPRYLASARVFGASELTLITRVYFWHALGAIIMSVKTGVAMGLVMLVIAEMYGGRTGIGYVLNQAKDYFQISKMVVCMVTLGLIGWFLIEILKFVELKLAVWKAGR